MAESKTATPSKAPTTPAKEPEQRVVAVQDIMPMYELASSVSRQAQALVDAIVQRGAIRGDELTTVGQLRDRSVQLIQLCENFHSSLEED